MIKHPTPKLHISEIIIAKLLNREKPIGKNNCFRLDVILAIVWKYWVVKSLVLDDFKLIVTEQNSQMSEPTYLYCIASLQHM